MISVAFVGGSFFLSICLSMSSITQKRYERIAMTFYGGALGGNRNKSLKILR